MENHIQRTVAFVHNKKNAKKEVGAKNLFIIAFKQIVTSLTTKVKDLYK